MTMKLCVWHRHALTLFNSISWCFIFGTRCLCSASCHQHYTTLVQIVSQMYLIAQCDYYLESELVLVASASLQ